MAPDRLLSAIRAALDDTEQKARRAGADQPRWAYNRETFTVSSCGGWCIAGRKDDGSPINDVDGEHIAHHDPAAVLRWVAAMREVVAVHAVHTTGFFAGINCQQCEDTVPCETIRALARGLGIDPEETP